MGFGLVFLFLFLVFLGVWGSSRDSSVLCLHECIAIAFENSGRLEREFLVLRNCGAMASAMAIKVAACASPALKLAAFGYGVSSDAAVAGRRSRRRRLRERTGSSLVCAQAGREGGAGEEVAPVVRSSVSRRQALALTTLSAVLFSSSQQAAQARDIPVFGFRKVQKQV